MLYIFIPQTQSPLKCLPDSITGHRVILFWGGGKMPTLSCPWKKCCCHPVLRLGASCHCSACWGVLVSAPTRARRSWDWLKVDVPRTCVHGLLHQWWVQPWKELIHSPKSRRDLSWLCGYHSKTSRSRNDIFMETLKTSSGVWCHFIQMLVQISS